MAGKLRTRTNYNFNTLEELQMIAGKTFDKVRTRRKRIDSGALGAVLIGASIYLYSQRDMDIVPAILVVIGVLLLARAIFFYSFTAWVTFRYMGKKVYYNDFVFEEDAILALANEQEQRYPYTDCKQLVETERCIYFLMEGKSGLMLDKHNVKGGSSEILRQWMEKKTGKTLVWMGRRKKPEKA